MEDIERSWFSVMTLGAFDASPEQVEKQELSPDDEDPIDGGMEFGSSGLRQSNGYVYDEWHPRLRGKRGVQIYREMRDNDAIVGAMLYAIESLIMQAAWKIETVEDPTEAQIAARDLVEGAMFKDMDQTWQENLGEILSMITFGWYYAEVVYKRRSGLDSVFDDGKIGWKKFAPRGQDTLERWEIDKHGTTRGMHQADNSTGTRAYIPLAKALHFTFRDYLNNPEGRSGLRAAYTAYYFRKKLQEIEAIGIERDLNGLPKMEMPERVMAAGPGTKGYAARQKLFNIVKNVRVDEQMGVIMPAEEGPDGKTGYKFSLMSTGGKRASDAAGAISRYSKEIAMSLLAQFLFLGMDRTGSFALAEADTALFAVAIGATMDRIVAVINRQAIPPLMRLNGIPQEDWPHMVHGDVETRDIAKLAAYVKTLAETGALTDVGGLEAHLREAGGLPPREAAPDEDNAEATVDEAAEPQSNGNTPQEQQS